MHLIWVNHTVPNLTAIFSFTIKFLISKLSICMGALKSWAQFSLVLRLKEKLILLTTNGGGLM